MHEILTLQLGEHSNFNATHFWNTQESYFTFGPGETPPVDHDIHWRVGLSPDGSETSLPRTVIYDAKAKFGSLRKICSLYEVQDDLPPDHLWRHPPVVRRQSPIPQTEYQESLSAGTTLPRLTAAQVRYWSDFSRVFFHPKSLVQLSDMDLNPGMMSLESHSQGQDLFSSLDKEYDLLDRDMRPFIEECDLMQGVQVMMTLDDVWGGFASCFMERMRDEYGKSCIWVWAGQSPQQRSTKERRRLAMSNTARTLTDIWQQASMVIPLSPPQSQLPARYSMESGSRWHTSALLATGIETAILATRLPQTTTRLHDIVHTLNLQGRRTISRLQMSVHGGRFDEKTEGSIKAAGDNRVPIEGQVQPAQLLDIDFLGVHDLALSHEKPSDASLLTEIFAGVHMHRGRPNAQPQGGAEARMSTAEVTGNQQTLRTQTFRSSLLFPILDCFPEIFSATRGDADDLVKVGVDTLLSTDSTISKGVKALRAQVVPFLKTDDRETVGNALSEIYDEYNESWSSGSDDGGD